MPSRALPPLHLYRHLLREASYLPPFCAPYVRLQITTRFKKHQHDAPSPSPFTVRRLRAATQRLGYLRAANAGVLDNMTHILQLATGRLGRRRRALLAQHFCHTTTTTSSSSSSSSSSSTSSQPAATGTHKNSTPPILTRPHPPDWLDAWDIPKLTALVTSQSRNAFPSPRPEVKKNRLAPAADEIPTTNTLGQPLGIRATRGKLRKWYKALLHRVMAPLPRAEWEALGRLARGEDEVVVPARRARAAAIGGEAGKEEGKTATTTTTTTTTTKAWDWKEYAVAPVRHIERGQSRAWKARTGEEGVAPYGTGPAIGVHRYDCARMWSRLYMRMWVATPTMEEVEGDRPGERKWKVEWGKKLRNLPVATPAQMDFFEGVSEEVGATTKPARKLRAKYLTE